jgi:hypothetical protein
MSAMSANKMRGAQKPDFVSSAFPCCTMLGIFKRIARDGAKRPLQRLPCNFSAARIHSSPEMALAHPLTRSLHTISICALRANGGSRAHHGARRIKFGARTYLAIPRARIDVKAGPHRTHRLYVEDIEKPAELVFSGPF